MKRIAVLGMLLVLGSGISFSQIGFGGGIQGGVVFSSFPKDTKDYYGTGFGFGAHGDLTVLKFFAVRLSVDYTMIPSNKTKFAQLLAQGFTINGQPADPTKTTVTGLNAHDIAISVSGIGKIPAGRLLAPYGIVGVGVHIMGNSDANVSYTGQGDITDALTQLELLPKSQSKTKFGLHFGAGTEFRLGIAKLFVEVKYVLIFTEGSSTGMIPVLVGVTIG